MYSEEAYNEFVKWAEEEKGIHIEKTKVGDRYVLENMRENGYNLGGEQSGHVIFLDDNTTGDGLLSALHLLQVMVDTKKPLSELASVMEVMEELNALGISGLAVSIEEDRESISEEMRVCSTIGHQVEVKKQ